MKQRYPLWLRIAARSPLLWALVVKWHWHRVRLNREAVKRILAASCHEGTEQ